LALATFGALPGCAQQAGYTAGPSPASAYDHLAYEPSAAPEVLAPIAAPPTPAAPDPYCAEALAEAQDAAARAHYSGTPLDLARANRTAAFRRRDCP
jgi:hypothetical protein